MNFVHAEKQMIFNKIKNVIYDFLFSCPLISGDSYKKIYLGIINNWDNQLIKLFAFPYLTIGQFKQSFVLLNKTVNIYSRESTNNSQLYNVVKFRIFY